MSNLPTNTSSTKYRQGAPAATSSTQKSSAQAVGGNYFPTKEEALISPYVERAQVKEYVILLSKIINPVDIRYCLRISRNRVNIFLKCKEGVDYFLRHHTRIKIDKK